MVLTITATPNTEYNLASLKVNDTDFTSGDTYIVNSDVKVEASFSKIPKPEPDPEPGTTLENSLRMTLPNNTMRTIFVDYYNTLNK